ncbi:hypothetical protein ACN26Y_17990 [Micromonospora sp. WMMD558]|uniref:hypothetical protein n=1 Tax=Micromonospora sp. WMMD558 TaxID=3403462 RepID=UPI003BF61762
MRLWCGEGEGAVSQGVGLAGEGGRGKAGRGGQPIRQSGHRLGLVKDDAGEVLAVDVGGVEDVTDRIVNRVEEGLRGDRDIVAGDHGGFAGRGEQDRRAVLRNEELSGLADGFQQDSSVLSLVGYVRA